MTTNTHQRLAFTTFYDASITEMMNAKKCYDGTSEDAMMTRATIRKDAETIYWKMFGMIGMAYLAGIINEGEHGHYQHKAHETFMSFFPTPAPEVA